MNKLFVKICGLTRSEDAELAVELGASALGFVFWPRSPRYISPSSARSVITKLAPDVIKVGVFVDEPMELVTQIMETVGLDIAQLHGSESPEYCRELTIRLSQGARGKRQGVIKAFGVKDNGTISVSEFDPDVLILVDAHDPVSYGGTGRLVNWESAREIASLRRTILAGGLHPGNVSQAVDTVRPFGVDVSSGVESAPGIKDPDRLKSFFEALHD
jgi:phosphoribosylanthranilate isomerase